MPPLQFFSQNMHFAINLFAALVFFAMFWLYVDAWTGRKALKELLKWAGCLLLSISFLLIGTIVEDSLQIRSIFGEWTGIVAGILQLVGFAAIIWGQIIDPLQDRPVTPGIEPNDQAPTPQANPSLNQPGVNDHMMVFGLTGTLKSLLPLGSLAAGFLYWRRATVGLERHLKPVAIGFGILSLSSLVGLSSLGADTTNPVIYKLTANYGWLWWASRLLLLMSSIVLARWVWRYLVKRILSQIFMIFTAMVVVVFLVTTLSFSFLLVRSIQNDTLNSLENASSSLKYALDGKKVESRTSAEVMAANPAVASAILAKDHNALVEITRGYLVEKKLSSLTITTAAGQVLLRADDPSRWGDSMSDDSLIVRASEGKVTEGLTSKDDAVAPVLLFRSAVPVKSGNQIIGVVIAGLAADTGFVDGVKQITGMDVSVYSGNIRSATTLIGPDGKTRLVGIKETDSRVNQQVQISGKTFKGVVKLMNQPYMAVYAPLKNYDGTLAGMLLVGRPHTYILQTAGHSIELTFLLVALMIVLSIYPAYLAARHIAKQVQ